MAWRGNLSKKLKEVRFLFCQTSPVSSAARSFVEKNYTDLKKLNPRLPILIRECSGTEPQLWARYALKPVSIGAVGIILSYLLGIWEARY